MKIKPKQYALGLFESLIAADEKERKDVIDRFAKILIRNNDVSKLGAILEYFSDMYNEHERTVEAEILSTHELNDKSLKDLKELVMKKAQADNIEIKERRSKKLLGGVVLKYGDKSLDLSLRRKLDEFKRVMID